MPKYGVFFIMEETRPCYTCIYHEGGWQNCSCIICLPAFHSQRCIEDKRGHCIFYKEKKRNDKEN